MVEIQDDVDLDETVRRIVDARIAEMVPRMLAAQPKLVIVSDRSRDSAKMLRDYAQSLNRTAELLEKDKGS